MRARIVLALALLGVAIISPLEESPAAAHQPPTSVTRSYYITTANPAEAQRLGCNQGGRNGRMSLYFGAPVVINPSSTVPNEKYGTTFWGGANQSLNQIEEVIKGFIRGYADCKTSSSAMALVGVGTSNSGIDGDSWIRHHGKAWSQSVKNLNYWAQNHHGTSAAVYGAYDAEPSWASFNQTHEWQHGYALDIENPRPIFVNSSADGCPQSSASNGACNNGWTQSRVRHIADYHAVSLAIPQIYAEGGANARQWARISQWAYHADGGDDIYFYGVMTQHGACESSSGGCPGTANVWTTARDQLSSALRIDSRIAGRFNGRMTDIRWFGGY
jgi:hypothetical protein